MLRVALFAGLFAVVLGVSGCGGGNQDGLVKDEIKAINDLADALEAKAPGDEVADCEKKLEVADKKLRAINPSTQDKEELFRGNARELVTALARLKSVGGNTVQEGLKHLFRESLYPTDEEKRKRRAPPQPG